MSFIELATKRKSVRSFTQEKIPNDAIEQMILAACNAPSAGNFQPWHFYAIKDSRVIQSLNHQAFSSDWISTAPAMIVVCIDQENIAERYGMRGRELYAIQDTAAAIQSILLCAADQGIGSCWVGDFDEKACASALQLPERHRPVALLPMGYPKGKSRKPPRRPMADILTVIEDENADAVRDIAAKKPAWKSFLHR